MKGSTEPHAPLELSATGVLPDDGYIGTLIGRVWIPEQSGPSPVIVTEEGVFDIGATFATVSGLSEQPDPAGAARAAKGTLLGTLDEILRTTTAPLAERRGPWLLSPIDLQTVKAAGVTFAASMIERVIEERARGDLEAAARFRGEVVDELGETLTEVRPGSPAAERLKSVLRERGMWSQYLEVGLGPDAEIFTKAPTLSTVGLGSSVGVLGSSEWNNPEPEVTIVVDSQGRVVGATLGNDVNLRDIEGRSALLLPKAKDNNASCAVGPFIRLFDETFDLDAVRSIEVHLSVVGQDGFTLDAVSNMRLISRDPADLVAQLVGPQHQYPDGALLMLGTMFAPVDDRDAEGMGFTHHAGDVVRISAGPLGALVNDVQRSEDCDPWTFGIADLMRNLAARGRLSTTPESRS